MKAKLLFMLLIICSCNRNKVNQNTNKISVEPNKIVISGKDFKSIIDYNNIIDYKQIIKLETNKNSAIGKIVKIEAFKDKFYILDNNQVIFIFDCKGKFYNKIDKKGKGPEEYRELRDFYLDENANIFILSYDCIYVFDSDSNFIKKIKIKLQSKSQRELFPLYFFRNKDYTFFYTGSFGLKNEIKKNEYALCCVNNNSNNIVKEFLPVKYQDTGGHQRFNKSNEKIYLTHIIGNDTIYQIDNQNISPIFHVDFLDKKIPKNILINDRNSLYNKVINNDLCGNISDAYENFEYFCFKFVKGNRPIQALYNKKNKLLRLIDIQKSLPFPLIFVDGVIQENFFTVQYPYLIKMFNQNGEYDEFLMENELNLLSDTDNPFIVIFNFKF